MSAVGELSGVMESVFTFQAYGVPKPKGSLRHVGKGRMVEQVAGAPVWREAVKAAALAAILVGGDRDRFPLGGPVAVVATFTVPKPKSAPKTRVTFPVTRSSGDLDKLLRNLFDALVDVGVVGDDSQVVRVAASKVYPGEGVRALRIPGVWVDLLLAGDVP